MSRPASRSLALPQANQASVFAALGDKRRLRLVGKLCRGGAQSIRQLTAGSSLTRQAITKHLQVLKRAGVLRSLRRGRESLFEFQPEPIAEVRNYLDVVSAQWDAGLGRLKSFVER